MKIAVLGSTSHIAKNLIDRFTNDKLYLFSRSLDNLHQFVKGEYNAVINCIGIGTPNRLDVVGSEIFRLTEYYDNLITDYIKDRDCSYINFSSGIVHREAVGFSGKKYNYRVAKVYAEAKHRAYPDLNITDLRVFAFFSKYIDFNSGYFITKLISCVKDGTVFITGENNMVRDYVHPNDLFDLVNICVHLKRFNDNLDVYSTKPVTKFEIINYFVTQYGLKYKVIESTPEGYMSGTSDNYFTKNKKAELLGYKPKYSSMDCIIDGSKEILNGNI